jgi:type IV pilus assembly protein PilY1
MKKMNFTHLAGAITLGLAIGIPANAPADDTEIYTGDNVSEGIKPNVMFILDTSGSMGIFDGQSTDRLDRMKEALFNMIDNVDNVNIGLMRFTNPGGPVLFPIAEVDSDATLVAPSSGSGQTDGSVRIISNADDAEELIVKVATVPAGGPAVVGDVKLDSLYLELLDTPGFGTEVSINNGLGRQVGDNDGIGGNDPADDDAEHANNFYTNSSSTLETVFTGSSRRTVGLRFPKIETADRDTQGAGVLFSQLHLTTRQDFAAPPGTANLSGALDLQIFGLFAGNMGPFPNDETAGTCPGGDADDIFCRLGLNVGTEHNTGLNVANTGSAPAAFSHTEGSGNITDAIVNWTDVPDTPNEAPTAKVLKSPDIGPIVQEIFNHIGWQANSAAENLGIFYTGTEASLRNIHSRDSSSALQPRLLVDYVPRGNARGRQIVALRFQNVLIPQGATIQTAKLELTAVGQGDDAVTIKLIGEKVADAPPFSASAPGTAGQQLSTRLANNATAAVDWVLPATEVWVHEEVVQTPNIGPVLQEIVNQPTWCGRNDVVIFLDYKTVPGTPSDRRVFAYDAEPSFAATLKFDFDASSIGAGSGCTVETVVRQIAADKDDAEETASSGNVSTGGTIFQMIKRGSNNQKNGVIFRNVKIHPSSTILNAVVDFTAQRNESANATTVTVVGERRNLIARFESANNNITDRITLASTTASSSFSMPPVAVATGESVVTANIGSIISELTSSGSGWTFGDDVALLFTGNTGQTNLETHDSDASKAARLRVDVQYNVGDVSTPIEVTVRSRLKEIIAELTHSGNTPIVDTLYEAALYFRGEAMLYGAQRGRISRRRGRINRRRISTSQRNTRLSHPGSYVIPAGTAIPPGLVDYPAGCKTDDSNLSTNACVPQTIPSLPAYISPIEQSCQANFLVLLTDGSANSNNSAGLIRTATGLTACDTTFTNGAKPTGGEQCGTDLVKFLNDNDQSSSVAGINNVVTYTIGFNISTQFLKDLASEGGGQFFEASTAQSLTTVFQAILTDVLSRATSFAAPSLSVNAFNRLEDRNEVYFSLFEPAASARWDGNVKKFQLCQSTLDDCVTVSGAKVGDVLDSRPTPLKAVGDDGRILDTALSFWSLAPDGPEVLVGGAGADITHRGFAARRVLTYAENATQTGTQPAGTVNFFVPPLPGAVVPVSRGASLTSNGNLVIDSDGDGRIDNLPSGSSAQKLAQTKELLGLGAVTPFQIQEHIDWIRGKDVDSVFDDATFGQNRYAFGDPLHGNPLALTYGGTTADPIIKLVIGTNDGGIRFINSFSGKEEWVFFPPASMLPLQTKLRANPANEKAYGIDGSATPWIQDKGDGSVNGDVDGHKIGVIEPDAGDFIRIFIGQRRGGNQYWGLDISPTLTIPANQKTAIDKVDPTLMWRIRGGGAEFPMLGETWSRPLLTSMLVGNDVAGQAERKTVLIFAGGYEEASQDSGFQTATSQGNAIYIIEAETGKRLFYVAGPGAAVRHTSTPNVGVEVPEMLFPIPSDVSAFDSDGDGATDRVYVGDTGGQVWRVDLSPNRAAGAANEGMIGVVGKLAEVSGSPSVINVLGAADKRKFFFPPSVIQVRGAGSEASFDYDLVSIVTGNRSNPLNVTVQDRFYALRDPVTFPLFHSDGNTPPANSSGLAENYIATLNGGLDVPLPTPAISPATDLTDLTNVDTLSDLGDAGDSARDAFTNGPGYFIRLATAVGEKGLAAPVTIAGKLFFSTYLPQGVVSASECTLAEGRGLLYGINAITGDPIFNWNNSSDPTNLTKGDRTYALGAGIPSNPVPVFFPEKVMLLIGVGGGAEAVDPEIAVPKGRTYWLEQALQ